MLRFGASVALAEQRPPFSDRRPWNCLIRVGSARLLHARWPLRFPRDARRWRIVLALDDSGWWVFM
jgi:hypothetical protein